MTSEKDMRTGFRSITTLYQGKTIDVSFSDTVGREEVDYRLQNSLVIHPNPSLIGTIATFESYGMQFQHSTRAGNRGVQAIIEGLHNRPFRSALVSYILSYVKTTEIEILRLASTGNIDQLSRMVKIPRDDIVDQLPPIPEGSYLDLLGDGSLSKRLGLTLANQGIYPLPGPIYDLQNVSKDRPPSLVTSFFALHHLPDPEQVLRSVFNAMAPGGAFMVSEYDYVDQHDMDIFLDAISSVSDLVEGDDPSRLLMDGDDVRTYRPRFEWHTMIIGVGFQHMSSPGSNVRLQMISKKPCSNLPGRDLDCGAWMANNPRRRFLSIYRKPPIGGEHLPLSIPRVRRDVPDIGTIFSRRGGRSGSLPPLKEGVNYDTEALINAIPWRKALEISKIIMDNVRTLYPRRRLEIIIDGAGIGTLAIGLIGNPVLNPIQALESVPRLHRYLIANIALYGSGPLIEIQEEVLYRVPVSTSQEILIRKPPSSMDVTIASRDSILFTENEGVARKAIASGTLMVALYLPTEQSTSLPATSTSVPGLYILVPSTDIVSEISTITSAPQDFLELLSLIRDRFPDLLPMAENIIPGVTIDEEDDLRRQVQQRLSGP